MINIYDTIRDGHLFRKMEVSELLFVEYTCMQEETRLGIWSNNNYFAFVLSGKKAWRTTRHLYEVSEGDILFIKKGANLTHQFFDDEFCAVFIFIPDDFIQAFIQRNTILPGASEKDIVAQDAILPVQRTHLLESFRQSVQSYLVLPEQPNEQLILLKFEELLLSLYSDKMHRDLTDYFGFLCQGPEYHMAGVMDKNYAYNLKLEDYARLCHMSLSAFKKAFKQQYDTTPAAWLLNRKLDLALNQVLTTSVPIGQVSLECGFEDASHFIRVFKHKHGLTPLQYRQKHSKNVVD